MPNRLVATRSTYLRQHAGNPVDWYPWGEQAFAQAVALDRPILLSVGYAACHWCHVMAHESFEDAVIAQAINRATVPVKVDRQEHPDVDSIYQTLCQLVTGQAGWPLTVFLTPDRRPFYVGTYFPPHARYGRPGLSEVLAALSDAWRTDRPRLLTVADDWAGALRRLEAGPPAPAPAPGTAEDPDAGPSRDSDPASGSGPGSAPAARSAPAPDGQPRTAEPPTGPGAGPAAPPPWEAPGAELALLARAVQELLHDLDPLHGGFGGAPKFPHTEAVDLLLRAGGGAAARAHFTLRCMAGGGIYDHVGGGFHRYSVDGGWQVPHFEKMLYDNALIPLALLAAHQQTADPEFAAVTRQTLDYLLRDMRDPAGGFYSAEDADSPGPDGQPAEGAFYTWTPDEVHAALGDPDLAALACRHFGISDRGNFEGGRTVPHLHALSGDAPYAPSPAVGAAACADHPSGAGGMAATPVAAQDPASRWSRVRAGLFRARQMRPRPGRDEQVLAGWNGLALAAFARAGRILGEARYLDTAVGVAAFLLGPMRAGDGGLLRRYYAGEAGLAGTLEDYAYVTAGLIDLYEATLEARWLAAAVGLARESLERFWEPERAAFYLVERGRDDLLYRPRDMGDGGTPSAEAWAVLALLRLAPYVSDPAFTAVPAAVLRRQAEPMARHARGMASLLCALDFAVKGPVAVVLAADDAVAAHAERLRDWRGRLAARYLPNLVLSRWAEGLPGVDGVPPVWAGRGVTGGQPTIWVCPGQACLAPAHTWEEVDAALGGR